MHGTGKRVVFKTRVQEMGYVEELKHFISCVAEKETLLVSPEEIFDTGVCNNILLCLDIKTGGVTC